MNAGLLGEHLASPRTAQKTNQSTDLDPKTANGGESTIDGFASFVAQESQAPSAEQTPPDIETALIPALAPDPTANPALSPSLEDALAAPKPKVDTNAARPNPEAMPPSEIDPRLSVDLTVIDPTAQAVGGDPLNGPAAIGASAEVLAQDPRVRTQSDSRDTIRAPRGETVKFDTPTGLLSTEISADGDVAISPDADLDARRTIQFGASSDGETPRPSTVFGTGDAIAADDLAAQLRNNPAPDASTLDRAFTSGMARELATIVTEPTVLMTGPTPSASTPTVATPNGLIPTVPSIPLATPNDLTGIIVNAVNSGLDGQEQLVIQMDPPELGRVLIDFKFDAQGLQQVVVTTENPEALKRLRELHFELTQALKEHGLSEQNMSFQQQAESGSQDAWTANQSTRQEAQFIAAEERRASPSATPIGPRSAAQERLDLLL